METPIQRQKRIETRKRLISITLHQGILNLIIIFILTLLLGKLSIPNIILMIIETILVELITVTLCYTSTDDKKCTEEPGLLLVTPKGRKKFFITLAATTNLSFFIFNSFGSLFGFYHEGTFKSDESKSMMRTIGFVIGIATALFLSFFDGLYIPFFSKTGDMKESKKEMRMVLNQTLISVMINYFLFFFMMFWVKIYYLAVYKYDKVAAPRFDLSFHNVITTLLLILYYSFIVRFNFVTLSKKMSLELPIEDKLNQ